MISGSGLEDTGQAGPLQYAFIGGVAVAPQPSGWLVAACTGSNIFVDVLDATGKKVARTVIDDGSNGARACEAGTLALAARPTGGALMVWGSYYGAAAVVVIAADGLSAGKPQDLADPQTYRSAPPPRVDRRRVLHRAADRAHVLRVPSSSACCASPRTAR